MMRKKKTRKKTKTGKTNDESGVSHSEQHSMCVQVGVEHIQTL